MRVVRAWPVALGLAVTLLAAPAHAGEDNDGTIGGNGDLGAETGSETQTGGQQGNNGNGTPGTPAGGSTVYSPPPPCRYVFWDTGPGLYATLSTFIGPVFQRPPQAALEAHKDDPNGAWYRGECTFKGGDGSPDALERRANQFYAANPPVWATSTPPAPPIPVVDLIDYAKDSAQIPQPLISLNPASETSVGLRTWVWPTGGAPRPVTARAESGPNWAQVTATPGRLQLSAPNAEVGDCATARPYTPGAPDSATRCYVTFRRSSARTGSSTVSARIVWRVVLTTSDGRNEVLDAAFPSSTDVSVTVSEVQSVVVR